MTKTRRTITMTMTMMTSMFTLRTFFIISIIISTTSHYILCETNSTNSLIESHEEDLESNIYYIQPFGIESRHTNKNISAISANDAKVRKKNKIKRRKNSALNAKIRAAALQGLDAMIELYERKEPEILRKGEFLDSNHPAALLSLFSAPMSNETNFSEEKAAYASLYAAKKLQESINLDFTGLGRQTEGKTKISLRRTPLEGLCPPRDLPICNGATRRYRTHDGTCNNPRKPRWGSAHMPFHRFLPPDYSDGLEEVRGAFRGGLLPSARFVSLVVHGFRNDESEVTMILPQWGQLIDHDMTATLQPRSINGTIPKCCSSSTAHPSCLPMKVPRDDPFLAKLGVRCLEFLRSAAAQRRDCLLSWREQTNQVTSYIDASAVYSSNPRTADNARIQRDGLLLFGRGPPREDPCLHGGFGHQCIRAGDSRAGEQPGLLALHTVFVAEHNRITLELVDLNPHWSDEKLYQETRRIIGAMFQHITYREYLPLVLGREVCRLFDLELKTSGYYDGYDTKVNPTIANSFSAAAYRFGHAMIQGTLLRSDTNFRFINNNVTLHEENSHGDIGGSGSLHRIIRGMAEQRTLKRDEFMSPELTNHLFQSGPFPFGMDLAAINIQRGRDHGIPAYIAWREPCGLSPIESWIDLENVAGPNSANRMRRAYETIEDIDLFVGGIAERPVRGGLVGPTFACIIAQQFSNLRKGDRFWYENGGFESSFTPAQLNSLRQVSLSQILCRSLGSSNFLQPHAFLPAEFEGNERIRCGSGILAPINLTPWLERDPFHKEADFDTTNLLEPEIDIFLTDKQNTFSSTSTANPFVTFNKDKSQSTSRPNSNNISNNIDFNQVIITARPMTSKTTKATIINDKIDFSTSIKPITTTSTTTRPKKKRTTTTKISTKRPNITIIDNKIDFSLMTTTKLTTKRPFIDSPFSKSGRDSNTTIVKRSTRRKRPNDKAEHRSDLIDLTDDTTTLKNNLTDITQKRFRNEDNATIYLDNKAITLTTQTNKNNNNETLTDEQLESRINHNFYGNSGTRKQQYDYGFNPQRPNNVYPLYPPLSLPNQQMTTRRPILIENNRPTYDYHQNTRPRPQTNKPISSPISNKLSTPFSYDTFNGNGNSYAPQINYDNMAIPLFISPNQGASSNIRPTYQNYYRPTYATTRRQDLTTFLIVQTTKRTTPQFYIDLHRTSRRPTNFQSNKDVFLSLSPQTSSSSSFYDPSNTNKYSYFISNTKFSTKKPPHVRPLPSSSYYKPSYSDYSDNAQTNDEDFDGYLRPENNFYIPLVNNHNKFSYNDYTKYNDKSETSTIHSVKYYFKQNILHKYHTIKSSEAKDNDEEVGLYDKDDTRRYAEIYDEHITDDDTTSDDFVTLARTNKPTETDGKKNEDMTRTLKIDGRQSNKNINALFANTLFVPFKVLTSETRPDNWVNVNIEENEKLKTQKLPEVPTLKQDTNFARELPKPFKA